LTNADDIGIIEHQRKKEKERKKMEKVTHINDFIASLPKIRKRRIWSVVINGTIVQGVSASDNKRSTAEKYIAGKYPNQAFTLIYRGWKI
jgi:hypothetical protein